MSDIYPSSADSHSIEGKRILIVEDNVENMRLFQAVLKLEGAGDVYGAERAVEGIAIAEKELPDLILMDIQMPGMDGMETSRRVRALGLDPEPYIIALTAHASSEIRSRCLAAGMNDHLAKPLHRPALERSLAAAAASRG